MMGACRARLTISVGRALEGLENVLFADVALAAVDVAAVAGMLDQ